MQLVLASLTGTIEQRGFATGAWPSKTSDEISPSTSPRHSIQSPAAQINVHCHCSSGRCINATPTCTGADKHDPQRMQKQQSQVAEFCKAALLWRFTAWAEGSCFSSLLPLRKTPVEVVVYAGASTLSFLVRMQHFGRSAGSCLRTPIHRHPATAKHWKSIE